MCSVTWKSAVRLVFWGSSEVGSAWRPTLRMPPRLGWPAAGAAVGCAAAAAAVVGCAAAPVAGAAAVVAPAAVVVAGALVGFAAATAALVGWAAGAEVGAVGAAAGPHAARKRVIATSSRRITSPYTIKLARSRG